MPPEEIVLTIQADDFGGARAFTDGILDCYAAGAVTQASVITVSPHAERDTGDARAAGLPLGVHLTLASEWAGQRWAPLGPAPSLRAPDSCLFENIDDVRRYADPAEVDDELARQVQWLRNRVPVGFVDCHQHVWDGDALARFCARHDLRSRDLTNEPGSLGLDSLWHLSTAGETAAAKVDALRRHLVQLQPGNHMIVVHPARHTSELMDLCPPESRRYRWATSLRLDDYRALLEADLLDMCRRLGISLLPTTETRR